MFARQPLINNIATAFKEIYQYQPEQISLQFTKKEFNGDFTITLFQYSKQISQKPEEMGHSIGKFLIQKYPEVFSNYEVVKGFLNLSVTHQYLLSLYQKVNENWGMAAPNSTNTEIMIEYSSPNTNKPLHLGPSE